MKLIPVSDLFDVRLGSNLELNSLEIDPSGVNFVSRTALNNGVSARVKLIEGLEPIEGGVITVAGGGSVAEAFMQPETFYSGRDLFCLRSKTALTVEQKLFYCTCIRANKFRFNYGRQANKTLPTLLIPALSEVPPWVGKVFDDVVGMWKAQLSSFDTSA